MQTQPEPIKTLDIVNLPPKVQVITHNSEVKAREQFVLVARWLEPKDPNKPTYAYTLSNMIRNFESKGYKFNNVSDLMVLQITKILKSVNELTIYDNRNILPYPVIAYYNGIKWIQTEHPYCNIILKKLKVI